MLMMLTTSPGARPSGPSERLLTPRDAAEMLRVSMSWLAKARLSGNGPRFVKIGRSVRYPESFIREYIKVCGPAPPRARGEP
jgi:predicted DNA-binding transcriptional regulator AlpA